LHENRDDTGRLRPTFRDYDAGQAGPRTEGVLTVLCGMEAGSLFTLDAPRILIGRSGEAQIQLDDRGLSRRHACIAREGDEYWLEDLGSTNGTRLDGMAVSGRVRLSNGSRIEVGGSAVLGFALYDEVEIEAARRTHDMMVRDPLTRLFNRRHMEARLRSEVAFAQRHHTPLALLMVDLDHFKDINDSAGHEGGDAVLRVVSRALERMLRGEDVLGRWGGEEFLVLARNIDKVGAMALAERIRRGIEILRIPVGDSELCVTASIGVAHDLGKSDAPTLLRSADEAMYAAKAAGRNHIQLASGTWESGTSFKTPEPFHDYPTDPVREERRAGEG